MKRSLFVVAATAALFVSFLTGCGGGAGGMMPLNGTVDTAAADRGASTNGWTVQVNRWNSKSSNWETILPGSGRLAVGDQIDLDLIYSKVLGRGRGGYDVVKNVKLPTGKVVDNTVFGKGGYTLPIAGEYKFTVTAAVSGKPHASLTVPVYDTAPFDLLAVDNTGKVLRTVLGYGNVPYFVALTNQKIRFAPVAKTRGGLDPSATGLRIMVIGTDTVPNFDYDMHDMRVVMFHSAGDNTVEMLIGLQGGDIAVLGRCNVRIKPRS